MPEWLGCVLIILGLYLYGRWTDEDTPPDNRGGWKRMTPTDPYDHSDGPWYREGYVSSKDNVFHDAWEETQAERAREGQRDGRV